MLFIILNVVILLLSIIVHEISHGFAALKLGDTTAKMRGRLTLNPIPHIDILGTILLPAMLVLMNSPFLFGWAKPVPVNPLNFRNPKRDMMITSLFGPLSNFALAIIFAILYRVFLILGLKGNIPLQVFEFGAAINILLFCFNLLPIPPLDGSKVLMYFMPDNVAQGFRRIEPFGFIIIFVLFFVGALGGILYPIMSIFLYILLGAGA
jgi:Zn-dependent protease